MKDFKVMSYIIHQISLWFLLDNLSPSIVIGFMDFTQDLLEEELVELRKTASSDLKEKGILTTGDKGQFLVISPLNEMLQTVAHPTHALLVGAHTDAESRVHSFHYNADSTLVHMVTCDEELYELSVIENRADLIDLILGFHTTKPQYQDPFEPAYLLKNTIDKARALTQTDQQAAATELLIAAGLEENVAQAYVETIQSPIFTMPLIAYWHMNDVHRLQVKGFITESNPEHLWIIEIIDEDPVLVRLTHASRSMLKSKLDTILP